MKPHYSEADLLETHFINPCITTDVTAHLETCSECADRFALLEEKLRGAAVEPRVDKPETFWARQKLAILRKSQERAAHRSIAMRTLRIAAAAVLAFFLGGITVYRAVEPGLEAPIEKHSATVSKTTADSKVKTDDAQTLRDPWQSDELKDFHSVVNWESWVETKNGGQS